ncbi:hypothetical protein CVT25_009864 [Psilocybe cyanescens]|uniref:Uncharacterized protein n=1 Tax=Psilocybe cyanescens TaxID=93625 RepID=A0A409XTK5_PSICY|nr:hypothetical protein CVT25_009864 [Psilocybe cyanescens]
MNEAEYFNWVPTQHRISRSLFSQLPSTPNIERRRRYNLSRTLDNTLDRVKVLGNGEDYGHSGQSTPLPNNKSIRCVNALSWAQDGDVLLTAGDDTTVRIWSMCPSNTSEDYPFLCRSVIRTGHRANIFSAKMLPLSSRIATGAGDMQIRVFDAAAALHLIPGEIETSYSANQCGLRVLRCHRDSVKKIITEESPDLFLSVSEDGTVRQHDLRTSHTCRRSSCPEPLVSIGHELSTLSLSPLVPYQFVVAGEGDCGYLYDRRHLRRKLELDWGSVPRFGEELTTCVRKFGRDSSTAGGHGIGREHITGSRMSKSNAYSRDGVYLFSTKDEPKIKDNLASSASSVVPSNTIPTTNEQTFGSINHHNGREHVENLSSEDDIGRDNVIDYDTSVTPEEHPSTPVVMPRRRYIGARNVMTVKDVNFLGPDDEWVVSGSDDGNFFIWNKENGSLKGIYEGDGTVVNVIEGHPHFPLLAISGIDTTVKVCKFQLSIHFLSPSAQQHDQLFAPTFKPSSNFSKIKDAEQIMDMNRRMSTTRLPTRFRIASLLGDAHIVLAASDDSTSECIGQ